MERALKFSHPMLLGFVDVVALLQSGLLSRGSAPEHVEGMTL
jgi:hypothetical protein